MVYINCLSNPGSRWPIFKSSHGNSLEDRASGDFIYSRSIFKRDLTVRQVSRKPSSSMTTGPDAPLWIKVIFKPENSEPIYIHSSVSFVCIWMNCIPYDINRDFSEPYFRWSWFVAEWIQSYDDENWILIKSLVFVKNLYRHYRDVIMGAMGSQITSLTTVYSTVYSGADQRKHQSSASLACVRGIHRSHKWPVTRKMFLFVWRHYGVTLNESNNIFCFLYTDCVGSRFEKKWPTIIKYGKR